MSAVATNGEIMVAPTYTGNAPKAVFRPVSRDALFDGPPAPPRNVEKQHPGASPRDRMRLSNIARGGGGRQTYGRKYRTFFHTKKYDFKTHFFALNQSRSYT